MEGTGLDALLRIFPNPCRRVVGSTRTRTSTRTGTRGSEANPCTRNPQTPNPNCFLPLTVLYLALTVLYVPHVAGLERPEAAG